MSNTIDFGNVTQGNFNYHRRVSIAYTLNNFQPVRCTIIGDQPLFFMDYEEDCESSAEIESLEDGVERLQQRISKALEEDSLNNEDSGSGETSAHTFALFLQDAALMTAPGAVEAVMQEDAEYLLSLLSKSHTAAALIGNARKYETRFVLGGAVSTALYDRRQNTVYINPHLDEADQLLLLTRELRRIWQHRQGALVHPLTFHPDQAVLIHRAQIADLCASMVRVSWELQLSGISLAWDRLEASSLADLTRAFAREAYLDFRSVNGGEASAAVFEAWFLSERCRQEDRRLIQQMLADYQGYVFENINPSTQVTAELILALGSQPAGKNYLSPYVASIMTDALFTEIRDRSNANFLWFIKFERSFRETEQELQTPENSPVPGMPQKSQPDAQEQNNIRFGDQHEQEADIVSLPRGKAHTGFFQNGSASSAGGATGTATVIEFRKQPRKA